MTEVGTSDVRSVSAASNEEWAVRVDLAAMFRLTQLMGWDDTVKYEWPALKRRCDRADPSYRN